MIKSGFGQITKRLTASMSVHYGPCNTFPFVGDSVDISLGGLYLKTELPLNIDEQVFLAINFPSCHDAVYCKARVAWVNPALIPNKPQYLPGVGVEFLNLTSHVENEIRKFINSSEHIEANQIAGDIEEGLNKEKLCDLHSSCSFFLRYKAQSCGSQYYYFVKSYCMGALGYRCQRRLIVKSRGTIPPDNMSPTGHLIIH